MNINLDDLSG